MTPRRPVWVTSFRYSPDPERPLAGQDAVVHGLLGELRQDPTLDVTVLTVRARDTPEREDFADLRVRYLTIPASTGTLAQLHRLSPGEVLRAGHDYGAAVGAYLRDNRPHPQTFPVLLNHDQVEASFLAQARQAGFRVQTLLHYLFSAFARAQVDPQTFAHFCRVEPIPTPIRWLSQAFIAARMSYATMMRLERDLRRVGLDRAFPQAMRVPFQRERDVLRLSHEVLVPSEAMRAQLETAYGPQPHVRVVPWASSLATVDAQDIQAVEHELGLRPGERMLLTMSRLSPEKGLDLLLEALRLWEQRQPPDAPPLVAVLCGSDDLSLDTGFRTELQFRTTRLQRVRVVLPGYAAGKRKAAMFARADVFAMPSLYEAYGLALVEALLAGVPVLASDTDGARQLVRPAFAETVAFEPPDGRAERLALGLERLLSRDLPAMRVASRRAGQAFAWPGVVAAIREQW